MSIYQSLSFGSVDVQSSEEANWLLVYDNARRLGHASEFAAAAYADRYGMRPVSLTA